MQTATGGLHLARKEEEVTQDLMEFEGDLSFFVLE